MIVIRNHLIYAILVIRLSLIFEFTVHRNLPNRPTRLTYDTVLWYRAPACPTTS